MAEPKISRLAKEHMRLADEHLKQAREHSDPSVRLRYYMVAYGNALSADAIVGGGSFEFAPRLGPVARRFLAQARKVERLAYAEAAKMFGIEPVKNPTEAETAAIGAGAGALLLGPIGALAGGYLGSREGKKRKATKKKAKKKNPKKRSGTMRRLLRGT